MTSTKIKIIGLCASPRAQSNSTFLLENVLSAARYAGADCEIVRLADLHIKPCIHCDCCVVNGNCPLNDDMNLIYEKIIQADAIIVSSPIYFMGVCAQLKLVIDRCQSFWAYRNATGRSLIPRRSRPRHGIFIAVGARNTESVFAGSLTTMRWFFDSIDMNFYHSLLVGKCENVGDIKNMPDKIKQACELGLELAESYK